MPEHLEVVGVRTEHVEAMEDRGVVGQERHSLREERLDAEAGLGIVSLCHQVREDPEETERAGAAFQDFDVMLEGVPRSADLDRILVARTVVGQGAAANNGDR